MTAEPIPHLKRTEFHDQPWSADALCNQTDPEAFFPDKGGSTREAKAVCAVCPVREPCLQWALDTDQRFGIWGGHSEHERRPLRKNRMDATTTADAPDTTAAADQDTEPATPPTSYGVYISATGHLPIPMTPNPLSKGAPRKQLPTGLDWSKHTAPEPEKPAAPVQLRCRWCRRPAEDLVDDVCAPCREAAERDFHAPDIRPKDFRADVTPELPMEGKQGKPTTGTSAPGATPTSSTTGRAPVAGPSTHEEKNPAAAPETRPAAAADPLDVVDHVAQLLRDTAHSADPMVQVLRGSALSVLAALDLAYNPETPVAATPPGPTTPVERPVAGKAATGSPRPRPTRRRGPRHFDIRHAQRLYLEEQKTCAEIATTLGSTVSNVRKQLKAAGTPMRDDRARGSGGWNRKTATDDDPQLVAAVRRHYLDEQLTLEQTSRKVGLSPKGLTGLMNRQGIPRRPSASTAGQAPRWRHFTEADVQAICDRYQTGDSTITLAKAYDVTTPTISNVLRRNGIPTRTPAEARALVLARRAADS